MKKYPEAQRLVTEVKKLVYPFCRRRSVAEWSFGENCPVAIAVSRFISLNHQAGFEFDRRVIKVMCLLQGGWNTPIRVGGLAAKVGLSASRLQHVFKDNVGLSIMQWIRDTRFRIAADLLRTTEMRISEICYYVGFGDPSNFSRKFRERYDTSPSDYRQRIIDGSRSGSVRVRPGWEQDMLLMSHGDAVCELSELSADEDSCRRPGLFD